MNSGATATVRGCDWCSSAASTRPPLSPLSHEERTLRQGRSLLCLSPRAPRSAHQRSLGGGQYARLTSIQAPRLNQEEAGPLSSWKGGMGSVVSGARGREDVSP